MRRLFVGLFAAMAALVPVLSFASRTVTLTVNDDETYEVPSELHTGHNTFTNTIVAHGGATIRLTGDKLLAYLKVMDGTVTLEAPTGVDTILMAGGVYEEGAARLHVVGAKTLAFGRDQTSFTEQAVLAATNITFAAEDACGIVLTNRAFVTACPPRSVCPIAIADDALVAPYTPVVFQTLMGDEYDLSNFTLDRWDLLWAENAEEIFPTNATVTVKPGRTLYLKPLSVQPAIWSWAGTQATLTPNASRSENYRGPLNSVSNIVLVSVGEHRARIVSQAVRECDLMAAVSGDGDIDVAADILNNEHFNLYGELTFTGTFTVSGKNAGVIARESSFGNPSNRVVLTGSSARLQLKGTQPVSTNWVYVADVSTAEGQILYAYGNVGSTWEIGTFRGSATLDGNADTVWHYRLDYLAEDAAPRLCGALADYALIDAAAGARLVTSTRNGACITLDLRDFIGTNPLSIEVVKGTTLKILGRKDKSLQLSGEGVVVDEDGTILPLGPSYELTIPTNVTQTVDVSCANVTNWGAKVTQWYDASETSTLGGYPTNADGTVVCYTNGYPIICRWGEKRTGTNGVHMFNGRSFKSGADAFADRHDEVNPYVVKGGLNGLDYVSMGAYQNKIDKTWQVPGASGTTTEARRLMMVTAGTKGSTVAPNASLDCKCAILVFGSQQGGGKAVLGGMGAARDTAVTNPFVTTNPESWTFYVDGVQTNGTACPNGGWQILTVSKSGGMSVNALGWNDGYGNSGGQNYAEILLFSVMPTDMERRACEYYLAKKWGLTASYRGQSVLPLVTVHGGGDLSLPAGGEMSGGFRGTVTVPAGQTLVISDLPMPPGEEAVPSANRLRWFDPDIADGLYCATPKLPLAVNAVWSRDETGALGSSNPCLFGLSGGSDRRPWCDRSARGDGDARNWLNYSNCYPNDTNGNTLRSRDTYGSEATTAHNAITNVRDVLMVIDSSCGGGSPLGFEVNLTATRRDPDGRNVTNPIWPRDSYGEINFTNITTRLDDKTVNGRVNGFSGCPEVFGITTDRAWSPAYFGAYNHGNTQAGGPEILGEMLFYSSPLTAAVRHRVTAYLAWKWAGKALDGYCDLTRTKVKGAGRVEAWTLASLPQAANDFAGTFAPQEANFSFTIDTSVSTTAATDAWTRAGTLELPAGAAITVNAVAATSGSYTLIERCTLAAGVLPSLTVTGAASEACRKARLILEDGALKLYVRPVGLVIFLR